jgi:hypothetical protein
VKQADVGKRGLRGGDSSLVAERRALLIVSGYELEQITFRSEIGPS